MLKNIPQGSATQFYAAVAPRTELPGGQYFEDGHVSHLSGEAPDIVSNKTLCALFKQRTMDAIKPFF